MSARLKTWKAGLGKKKKKKKKEKKKKEKMVINLDKGRKMTYHMKNTLRKKNHIK